MTSDDIRARVALVESFAEANDDERAHAAEDRLHQDVLMQIADGAEHPQVLAVEALRTCAVRFGRWCS